MESRKIYMNHLQGRNRDTDVQNKCMDTKKVEDGGGMNWEFDIFPLISIKYITNVNKLYNTGNST